MLAVLFSLYGAAAASANREREGLGRAQADSGQVGPGRRRPWTLRLLL